MNSIDHLLVKTVLNELIMSTQPPPNISIVDIHLNPTKTLQIRCLPRRGGARSIADGGFDFPARTLFAFLGAAALDEGSRGKGGRHDENEDDRETHVGGLFQT